MPTENAAQDQTGDLDEAAVWAEEMTRRQDPTASAVASEADEPTIAEGEQAAAPQAPQPEPSAEEKRLASLEAQNAALREELNRTSGRVAKMQSDMAKAAAKSVDDAPTDAQIATAAEDPEEWKQLMADFPDWGVAFEKKMDAKIGAVMKAQKLQAAAPSTDDVAGIVEKALAQREFARVDRKHPTWRATIATQEFRAWKDKQANEIKALYDSASSDDAIEMLNLYEGSKATDKTIGIAQRRAAALDSATVEGKPRQQGAAVKAAGDLTPAEAWALEKKQREKRRAAA